MGKAISCDVRVAEGTWGAYPPHNFDVRGAGTIAGCDCVYYSENVSLHHADEVEVPFALGYFAQVLDKIHNVCPVVHRVLLLSAYETSGMYVVWAQATNSF